MYVMEIFQEEGIMQPEENFFVMFGALVVYTALNAALGHYFDQRDARREHQQEESASRKTVGELAEASLR